MRRIDAKAVGRARTKEERDRRHLHGDQGAKFSAGKYMVLLGDTIGTVTTIPAKDNIMAEIYETDIVR